MFSVVVLLSLNADGVQVRAVKFILSTNKIKFVLNLGKGNHTLFTLEL